MKKILSLVILVLIVLMFPRGLFAGPDTNTFTDVTVDVVTHTVTLGTLAVPTYSAEIATTTAKIYISKIRISNSDASKVQTVSIYDDIRTTNTITMIWQVIFATGTTIPQTLEETFATERPLRADYGVYIRKSSADSTVSANILYW